MSFFSFFDKPKPSVAFSIDNGNLRWVALMRNKEGIQVESYGTEFLGPEILDESDTIVDDAKFVSRLRGVLVQCPMTEANLVIPDGEAFMFHTHVAKEPARHMEQVIIDHIKTYCQANQLLDLGDYICEYDVIFITDFGYDIHVTLVPKTYVAHMTRLFKQAGIVLRHIETAHHSVSRACLNIPNGTGYISVAFGKKKTAISLIHGEHLVSHDVVPIGVETLYTTVQKFLRISPEEAHRIIGRHGILQTHPDTAMLGELYMALAPICQSVDRQLIELGQMPYKTFGHRFMTRDMVVYGEGIAIKGLVGFLGEQCRLNAKELNIWAGHLEDRAPIMNLPASETLVYAEPLSLALLYLTPRA